MGGKRWTDTEIEFLKENYSKLGIRHTAHVLGRTELAVSTCASRLAINISNVFIKERLSKAQTGRQMPEAIRKKLSRVLTGKPHRPSDKYGKHRKGISPINKLSDEYLLSRIFDVTYLLDRPPQAHEMWELCHISDHTYARAFGSWNLALKAAGLPPAPPKKYTPPSPLPIRCESCGALIENPKWLNRRFCNLVCYGLWISEHLTGENAVNWQGGYEPYYGPNWKSQRRKARRRDGYSCRYCGITEHELGRELDVHHIIPFREFGLGQYKEANRLENLISLCPIHHHKQERGSLDPS